MKTYIYIHHLVPWDLRMNVCMCLHVCYCMITWVPYELIFGLLWVLCRTMCISFFLIMKDDIEYTLAGHVHSCPSSIHITGFRCLWDPLPAAELSRGSCSSSNPLNRHWILASYSYRKADYSVASVEKASGCFSSSSWTSWSRDSKKRGLVTLIVLVGYVHSVCYLVIFWLSGCSLNDSSSRNAPIVAVWCVIGEVVRPAYLMRFYYTVCMFLSCLHVFICTCGYSLIC